MTLRDIIAVYYENKETPKHIRYVQNAELLTDKLGGTYSYYQALTVMDQVSYWVRLIMPKLCWAV
jgi:hypothetical protein